MSYVTNTLSNLIHQTAFFNLTWGNYLMIAVDVYKRQPEGRALLFLGPGASHRIVSQAEISEAEKRSDGRTDR